MHHLAAHLTTQLARLPRDRGASSLETVVLVVALVGIAGLVVAALRDFAEDQLSRLPGSGG